MKRAFTIALLTVCFSFTALAQGDSQTAKLKSSVKKAGDKAPELSTRINVSTNVHVQAVLIPQVDARRIFGKEIAEHYAVVEVNIGNKSPDAALIIQGVFIDYSRWALRGGGGLNLAGYEPEPDPFQTSTKKEQVASEEYRVVRSQLLDAKMWSKRNWTMRLLTLAGSLAGAYPFPIGSKSFQKELTTFAGVFVPGVNEVWPDGIIQQLNNVSDFGFQSNKVISKQGSDIIVCFFPIERFLTPGFRKLYLKSPALFYSPLQMLADREAQKEVAKYLNLGIKEDQAQSLHDALPCYMAVSEWETMHLKSPDFDICLVENGLKVTGEGNGKGENGTVGIFDPNKAAAFRQLDFLNHVSLNSIIVTVDGVMSVDTTAIAGKIDILEFDRLAKCGDDQQPCFWAAADVGGGVRTGLIRGSYLTGASVAIAEAADLGITDIKTLAEGSSDQVLHFSFKLTKPVPRKTDDQRTILHFIVKKPQPGSTGANPKTLDSGAFEYPIGYTTSPAIKKVTSKDGKLMIEGNFIHDPSDSLVVKLHSPTGEEVEGTLADSSTTSQLVVSNLADAKEAGCWSVTVDIGKVSYPPAGPGCFCFFVKPSPKLEAAERHKDKLEIAVTGSDLVDTSECGGPKLGFKLVNSTGVAKPATVKNRDDKLILNLPKEAKEGSWTLKVMLGTEEAASVKVTDPSP